MVFAALLLVGAGFIVRATRNHWKVYRDYTANQSLVSFGIAGAMVAVALGIFAVSVLA
jgi:hypothetical protein